MVGRVRLYSQCQLYLVFFWAADGQVVYRATRVRTFK